MIVAFTGHRPEKLPWGDNESDPRCQALKIMMERRIRQAVCSGADTFLCGMARGCDLMFAEAVLRVREDFPGIRLEAWLPCRSQADGWKQETRIRYRRILSRCDAVRLVQDAYTPGCMLRRNRAMTDRADRLISVWDGSEGGTGSTVRYAQSQGKPVDGLWL